MSYRPSNWYQMDYDEQREWERQQQALEDAEYNQRRAQEEAEDATRRARQEIRSAEARASDAMYEAYQMEEELRKENNALRAQRDELVKALEEIAKREGPFKRDPLEFAESVIDNMERIANEALARIKEQTQ